MSLVPTYVKATDGLFYKNPSLHGKDWFICFDDDDPPELVVKEAAKLNPRDILKNAGIQYKNLRSNGYGGMRIFSTKEPIDYSKVDFIDSVTYYFDLTGNLDPKHISYNEGKKTRDQLGECVFYEFKK